MKKKIISLNGMKFRHSWNCSYVIVPHQNSLEKFMNSTVTSPPQISKTISIQLLSLLRGFFFVVPVLDADSLSVTMIRVRLAAFAVSNCFCNLRRFMVMKITQPKPIRFPVKTRSCVKECMECSWAISKKKYERIIQPNFTYNWWHKSDVNEH